MEGGDYAFGMEGISPATEFPPETLCSMRAGMEEEAVVADPLLGGGRVDLVMGERDKRVENGGE